MDILSIARTPPVTVSLQDSVMKAVDKMTDVGVGAVVVTEEARVVGIFTERDLLRNVVAQRMSTIDTPVSLVMTRNPHIVKPGQMTMSEAFEFMSKHHLRHLPLVDENDRLVAILSIRHLMRAMVDVLHQDVQLLNSFINTDWAVTA